MALIDYTTTGDFRTPEMPECFPISSLPVALLLRLLALLLRLRERKSHVEVSAWSANYEKDNSQAWQAMPALGQACCRHHQRRERERLPAPMPMPAPILAMSPTTA